MELRERLDNLYKREPAAVAVERPQPGARWTKREDQIYQGASLVGINANPNLVEVVETCRSKIIYKLVKKDSRPSYHQYQRNRPDHELSILAYNKNCGQRDENDLIGDLIHEAKISEATKMPVKVGNCRCRSVWCSSCHRIYYVPKYKDDIRKFDYPRTRQVILTVDRNKFENGFEALQTITQKKAISAFVRKLRNGKKRKIGNQWIYEYEPVKASKILSVLEFYQDGFPHWHLLVEVEKEGHAGMIGGQQLHQAWPYGIVKETYFRDQQHWNSIAGYFAEKGYFEKGKKYQTELPEDIKEKMTRRVRKMVFYPCPSNGDHEEIRADVSEDEAFREVSEYMEKKANEKADAENRVKGNGAERRPISYKAILEKCGKKTFIRTDNLGWRVVMIVPLPFDAIKTMFEPVYHEGKGYLCEMTAQALGLLESNAEWIRHTRVPYEERPTDIEPINDFSEVQGGVN